MLCKLLFQMFNFLEIKYTSFSFKNSIESSLM